MGFKTIKQLIIENEAQWRREPPPPHGKRRNLAGRLTKQQQRVLDLLRKHPKGLNKHDLARHLSVREQTIRAHIRALIEKGAVRTTGNKGNVPATYYAEGSA